MIPVPVLAGTTAKYAEVVVYKLAHGQDLTPTDLEQLSPAVRTLSPAQLRDWLAWSTDKAGLFAGTKVDFKDFTAVPGEFDVESIIYRCLDLDTFYALLSDGADNAIVFTLESSTWYLTGYFAVNDLEHIIQSTDLFRTHSTICLPSSPSDQSDVSDYWKQYDAADDLLEKKHPPKPPTPRKTSVALPKDARVYLRSLTLHSIQDLWFLWQSQDRSFEDMSTFIKGYREPRDPGTEQDALFGYTLRHLNTLDRCYHQMGFNESIVDDVCLAIIELKDSLFFA